MYKPYRLNRFWEATLVAFTAMSIFLFLRGVGFEGTVPLGGALLGLVLMIVFLEGWLPAYRFRQAAKQVKAHPEEGTDPKARTLGQIAGEIISEGPTFDPVIGRSSKDKKRRA